MDNITGYRSDYYTDAKVASLHVAFDLVKNAENWKLPIDALVTLDGTSVECRQRLAEIAEAVIFFAGCVAEITPARRKNQWHVRAVGYYEAVGS